MTFRRLRRPDDRERGSEAIEAAIGVPAFLLLIALVIFAGRIAITRQSVEAAAHEAARTASLARTAAAASPDALAAADSSLAAQGLLCLSRSVAVDTSGFSAPVGTPAQVTATVTCVVDLSDLGAPLPGSRTIVVTAVSPIDTYRERS